MSRAAAAAATAAAASDTAAVSLCAVLRLGSSLEALQAAQRAVHLSDGVLRLCLTVGHLNRALYLACDNLLWAAKTGVAPQLDQPKWSQRAFR